MRIDIYRAWTSSAGNIRLQPSAVANSDALADAIVKSNVANIPTPGHCFERLTNICNAFFDSMTGEQQVDSSLEDCAISHTILNRLAMLSEGADWKTRFRTNIALPSGPRKARLLSLIMDYLPIEVQKRVDTIEVGSVDDVLNADIGSRNPSMMCFWDTVLSSLEEWTAALTKLCPPSSVKLSSEFSSAASNGDKMASVFEKAMKNANNASLMAHASQSDSSESKAASAGTSVEKQKAIEVATSEAAASVTFREACEKAMSQSSDYLAWQTLLQNPDASRLLHVKIPSSVSNTNPHLAYISKMRSFQFMEMEKDFAAKHGGRFSHADAAKLVTRALLLEEHFWSGALHSA